MILLRIAAALAFTLMACNSVFASSPEPAPWGDPRTWKKQQPWDVGAGSEDSVDAYRNAEGWKEFKNIKPIE